MVSRYGGRVWVDKTAGAHVSDLPQLDSLPAGIERFVPRGVAEGQVALFLPSEQTPVVAELFLGVSGGLRVCPSPNMHDMHEFLLSLRELQQLPIERVLVSHGPPVLEGGRSAITTALDATTAS